ncbi:MAG: hypothetical protein Q8L85_08715 [Alphaproteobacteria bacterium]|nr:hypothetical protein [Alphaproteobacteria bacterium]
MKLKICLLALLTLLNYTVNAAGDEDNLAKRPLPEENDHPSKKKCLEENNNNNLVKYEYSEINKNEEENTLNSNRVTVGEFIDASNEETENEVDDGWDFHDICENPYYLLSDIEKQDKEKSLKIKIEDINTEFKNGAIDETARRRQIILAVSESFNVKLLYHFGREGELTYRYTDLNTNDIIHPCEDFEFDDKHTQYLQQKLKEKDIEFIKNFEYFSIKNTNATFLHPENFNKFLLYFPWIKKINCDFYSDESGYTENVFKKINAVFPNIEHLPLIKELKLRGIEDTNIDKENLPEWVRKIVKYEYSEITKNEEENTVDRNEVTVGEVIDYINNNMVFTNMFRINASNEETENEEDTGWDFHDIYENSYYLLSDNEKQDKEKSLKIKIEDINSEFKNGTIDEITRRKHIILAVSESFNVKLLYHFGRDGGLMSGSIDLNTNDIIHPSEDFEFDDEHAEYLHQKFKEKDIEFIKNFEYFSIQNTNATFLHPENFNKFLVYFPWIKKINCNFYCDEHGYKENVFKKINPVFPNIEHLPMIKELKLKGIEDTNIDKEKLPEWVHKIEKITII